MTHSMEYRRILREMLRDRSQTDLAKLLGVTQPTVSRWLGGAKPEHDHHDRIVRVAKDLHVIHGSDNTEYDSISIVGYVGAGGAILYSEGQGPFGEVPMPPEGATADTVAVVVRGDSMSGQLEDGWTIYYNQRSDPPTKEMLGKLCVIGLTDGRVLIKKLVEGRRRGAYDLYSANASPMLDQPVAWAAPVIWIRPS